jgi:Ala-tRNA(Pro) deacylase
LFLGLFAGRSPPDHTKTRPSRDVVQVGRKPKTAPFGSRIARLKHISGQSARLFSPVTCCAGTRLDLGKKFLNRLMGSRSASGKDNFVAWVETSISIESDFTDFHSSLSAQPEAATKRSLSHPARTMRATPEDLIAYLDALSIKTSTVEHPPLFTVEDSQALRGEIPGGHTKNLFVKDKKGRLFLLVMGEETVVDLKRVHEKIGAQGRVSFGSAELLEEAWGVAPGAVTPFGAINDEADRVKVVLDEAMMRHERLNFHPLVNTRTTGLASLDLVRFLRATGHEPLIAALGQEEARG